MHTKSPKLRTTAVTYAVLIVYFAFLLLPMFWIGITSLKRPEIICSDRLLFGLRDFTLENYKRILSVTTFPTYFMNSARTAGGVTAITVLLGIMGAYGLSRFRIKYKNGWILAIFSAQMFPPVLILIPLYRLMFTYRLVDTPVGVIIGQLILAIPFTLWMLKGYFDGVPTELDEAARIDGCGTMGIMVWIIVPTCLPGILVAAFFAFMVSWGDFLIVSLLAQSSATGTIPWSLQQISFALMVRWGDVAAMTVLTIAPTLVLFALVQRWLIEGLMAGAVKR